MSAGDVIAIYAAVVATGTFLWRVYEFRHARKQHATVDVRMGFLTMTDGNLREAILINVFNRGDHAIRVESAGLFLQDGSSRTMVPLMQPPGATIPGTIAPRDSAMTYFLADEAKHEGGIDPTKPLRSFANLSSGDKITSKPTRLFKS